MDDLLGDPAFGLEIHANDANIIVGMVGDAVANSGQDCRLGLGLNWATTTPRASLEPPLVCPFDRNFAALTE